MNVKYKKLHWIIRVFVVIIVIHTILVITGYLIVNKEISRIKEAGEPTTLLDLKGPKIPDDQNGGIILERLFNYNNKFSLQNSDIHLLDETLSDFQKGKAVDWVKCEKALSRIEPLVGQIDLALSKPKFRFNIDWENGSAARFPQFARERELERTLASAAIISAHSGNMNEAAKYLNLAFKMDNTLKNEPTLIALLVRIALIGIASNISKQSLEYGHLNARQARQLYDTISKIDLNHGYVLAMEGERVSGTWDIEHFSPGDMCPDSAFIENFLIRLYNSYPLRPLRYADELQYLKVMRVYVNTADLPYRIAKTKKLIEPEEDLPKYAVLSKFVLPVFGGVRRERDKGIVILALAQLRLACEAYRDRKGQYPKSISDIKTTLGWKIPVDPFSGKDFVYRTNKNEVIIYSIGPNLVDDGGLVPSKPYDLGGDIVLSFKR